MYVKENTSYLVAHYICEYVTDIKLVSRKTENIENNSMCKFQDQSKKSNLFDVECESMHAF